ncbi:MAG: pseudouridine synthase [Subdoligranulum sp.]
MKKFIAGENENGVRLSRFVESVTRDMPRSLLYKSFRNKRIKVNGKRGEADTRLSSGDVIELYINDEFFPEKPVVPAKKPPRRQPPVKVIYQDENIAVLYKPAHLLCHSDRTGDANLVDAFCAQLQASGEYDPKAENRFAPAICNRLDRGTEGLVIAAKKYTSLRDMNEIIRNDWMKKEYLSITIGARRPGGMLPGCSTAKKATRCAFTPMKARGTKIITDVTVIRCIGPFALCRIGLITGRTHQIRAHLAYLGHPVLGDIKYGNRNINEKTGFKTQALCAQRLTFGNIPEENTLHYLSGRVIKLADPEIVKQFDALERKPGQE